MNAELRMLQLAKKGDLVEYVRNNGEHEVYYLSEEVVKIDNGIKCKSCTYEIEKGYNKEMSVYLKQDSGDYWKCTIYEVKL